MKTFLIGLVIIMAMGMQNAGAGMNEEILTDTDKAYLLQLARQTVSMYLKDKTIPSPDETELTDNVKQKLGCFVTLEHRKRGLRGCIGIFERNKPLYKNVISRAVLATQDSRFWRDPVTYQELKDIDIEISVLTAPKNLPFKSPEDLLSQLRPNLDGVILYTRYGHSTYLPQVWEHFSRKKDFLSNLCQKHGAPKDTWKKDFQNVQIQTYQAVVFSEGE